MAGKNYQNEIAITINVATGLNLTTATTTTLLVKQPDGTQVEWSATVSGDATDGNLTYITEDGDLPAIGVYKLQAYVVLSGGGTYYGETVEFRVYRQFE